MMTPNRRAPALGSVLETCLYAEDLESAEQFYTTVLGLKAFSKQDGRHIFFWHAGGVFFLFNPKLTAIDGGLVPIHGASGPGHVAFTVSEATLPAWREHLAALNVAIETEVSWPRGGHSIYFRDPAGNSLELATADLWPRPPAEADSA